MKKVFLKICIALLIFSSCETKKKTRSEKNVEMVKDLVDLVESLNKINSSHSSDDSENLPHLSSDEIIKLLQNPDADTTDKAWDGIRALRKSNDPKVPDTLYKIYLSASKLKDYRYKKLIFYSLIEKDTEKSAEVIAKIFENNSSEDFDQSTLMDLYGLDHSEKLFPSIFKILKSNEHNSDVIFSLFKHTIDNKKITQERAISFLPIIENFYNYYKSEDLVNSIITFKDNVIARRILTDFLKRNTNYGPKTEWIVFDIFKALDEKVIPNGFFNHMLENVEYRLKVYTYLRENNKLNLLPKEYLTQEFLSGCFSIPGPDPGRGVLYEILTYPREKQQSAKYIGSTTLSKGNYYFYWVYRSDDFINDGYFTVTGPQPLDKSQFDLNPTIQGKIIPEISYKKVKNEVYIKEIIKNYQEE